MMVRKLIHNVVNNPKKCDYSSVISLFLSDPSDIINNKDLRIIESHLVLALKSDAPVSRRTSEAGLLK